MSFDIKSQTWDTEQRINRAKTISNEIIKAIDIKKSYSALEFGCGTGLISFNLYEKFEKITLIDTSKGMIDILNQKLQQNKVKNMIAYQMDINDQETLTDKFDVIYTSMVLHHILDTETTLKSLYNLLNKDGFLCVIDLDEEDGSFHSNEKEYNGHNGFNQDQLMNILRKVGFKYVESSNFLKDKKPIGNKDIEYTLFLMKGIKKMESHF